MRNLFLITCVATLLAVVGCNRQGTNTVSFDRAVAVESADAETRDALEYIVTDGGLNKIARVVEARQFFDRGTVPQVQVKVRNTTGRDQRFVYRYIWTEGGREIETFKSRNQEVRIKARDTVTLSGSAPSREVDGWELQLNRSPL
jgi:uncharacterized protein YcfL